MRNTNPKMAALIEGALMVALAIALNFLRLFRLPDGGSVDLAMIPIIIYAVRRGPGWGVGAGLAFGIIDFLLGGMAYTWQVIVLDYILAFSTLGLAGVFKGKKNAVVWGTLLAGFCKFLVHYISGVVLWAEYMPEVFFGIGMSTPYFYSLLYNGSFMGLNMVLCLIVCKLLEKPLEKALPAVE